MTELITCGCTITSGYFFKTLLFLKLNIYIIQWRILDLGKYLSKRVIYLPLGLFLVAAAAASSPNRTSARQTGTKNWEIQKPTGNCGLEPELVLPCMREQPILKFSSCLPPL
jgi:hypothetical protein